MNQFISPKQLRTLLLNAHKIKEFNKCEQCNATGYENWGDDGGDIKAGPSDLEGRTTGICDVCNGVGYKDIFMYSEEP